jgi:hypothetical protein
VATIQSGELPLLVGRSRGGLGSFPALEAARDQTCFARGFNTTNAARQETTGRLSGLAGSGAAIGQLAVWAREGGMFTFGSAGSQRNRATPTPPALEAHQLVDGRAGSSRLLAQDVPTAGAGRRRNTNRMKTAHVIRYAPHG